MNISDLPDDMQVLIADLLEIAGQHLLLATHERDGRLNLNIEVPVVRIALATLPNVPIGTNKQDNRTKAYAQAMFGQDTPPIIISGQQWLDGRHRVWAARQAEQEFITAIDLQPLVGDCVFERDLLGFISR